MTSIKRRRSLLLTALAFALIEGRTGAPLNVLHSWLSTWFGIGQVIAGMHRQGYDVQMTQYDERGWRATFYTAGMEHTATSATASAWEPTPWRAVQRSAWEALNDTIRGRQRRGRTWHSVHSAKSQGLRLERRSRTAKRSRRLACIGSRFMWRWHPPSRSRRSG